MRLPSRKLSVVSLYTGAGGLDFGFEAAGFETRVAIDIDADCSKTIKANRPWPVIQDDISRIPSKSILDAAGLRRGEVDTLIGGPPCQPFSKSAYWVFGDSGRLKDPRANTLVEFMRCVEDTLPKVFLVENVHGITYSGKEEGLTLLASLARKINRKHGVDYRLSWKVINAADFGVPQLRARFFLVASRDGRVFEFPMPTHQSEEEERKGVSFVLLPVTRRKPYITAWDSIGEFEPPANEDLTLRGYWADLLPSIPEGENYLWHTNRKGGLPLFGWRTRYWSFLLKLAKNRPAWTIQAQPGPAIGPFHWDNRRLSIEEMARLQTFPKHLKYVGTRISIQRQIGNAVPSLLAEVLAGEIRRQLLGNTEAGPLTHSVRFKRPIPDPNPPQPVPGKYLTQIGDHPDHPGEGKGPRIANHRSRQTMPSRSR